MSAGLEPKQDFSLPGPKRVSESGNQFTALVDGISVHLGVRILSLPRPHWFMESVVYLGAEISVYVAV